MSDDTALPRETGSDKSTATCATCGQDLPTVSSEYGSVSAGSCPKCSAPALEEAERAVAAANAERGYPTGEPSEEWKVDELSAYAEAAGVDLTGQRGSKATVLAAIGDRRVEA